MHQVAISLSRDLNCCWCGYCGLPTVLTGCQCLTHAGSSILRLFNRRRDVKIRSRGGGRGARRWKERAKRSYDRFHFFFLLLYAQSFTKHYCYTWRSNIKINRLAPVYKNYREKKRISHKYREENNAMYLRLTARDNDETRSNFLPFVSYARVSSLIEKKVYVEEQIIQLFA